MSRRIRCDRSRKAATNPICFRLFMHCAPGLFRAWKGGVSNAADLMMAMTNGDQ